MMLMSRGRVGGACRKVGTYQAKRTFYNVQNPRTGWRMGNNYYSYEDQVVPAIIGINCAVFGMWHVANPRFMERNFTVSVHGVKRKHRFHTLLTSAFSHFDFFHFAGNMFFLYIFGRNLVPLLGTKRFLGMYLSAGVLGSAVTVYLNSKRPMLYMTPSLGASGAVYSTLAYSMLQFPWQTVYVNFLFPVPLIAFGGLKLLSDFNGLGANDLVGHTAHLTGAGVGVAVWFVTRGRYRHF